PSRSTTSSSPATTGRAARPSASCCSPSPRWSSGWGCACPGRTWRRRWRSGEGDGRGTGGEPMNVAAPQTPALRLAYRAYVLLFFLYLAAPLVAASFFAFNDSLFPALPWRGFTLDWFFGEVEPKLGLFNDRRLLRGMQNSLIKIGGASCRE